MTTPLNLTKESWLTWPETQQLIGIFDEAGHEMRFVGGAVRDLLAGIAVKDVDIATPASPQQVLGMCEKAGIKVVPTGLSHGTVTAIINHQPFEITTLRCDVKTFGRHAEVQFTQHWEEDAARRDFTLNALYCDPKGRIYDYHHGLDDLRARHVKFIGNAEQRIREDGLRILRFFRFSARYGEGEMDIEGLAACHQCREMLHDLSGERIAQEMFRLLEQEIAPAILTIMQQQQLTLPLFGYQIDQRILECWPRIRLMADIEENLPNIPILLLGLLCRAQEGAMAEFITQRWKLSNADRELMHFIADTHLIEADADQATQKRLIRQIGPERFRHLLLASWTEGLSQVPQKAQMLSAAYRPMLWLSEHWQVPIFPIKGSDLIARGAPSGPQMGQWLQQLEQWWESENYAPTREQILERFESQR